MSEVYLKKLQEADAGVLFSLVDRNRPHLKKFIWEGETKSPSDSEHYIRIANYREDVNGAPTRGVFARGRLVGLATLHTIDWSDNTSSLGYWIDAAQTGNGYATKAVHQLLGIAFEDIGLDRVTACIEVENRPSLAVLGRLGFTLTCHDYQPTWRYIEQDAPAEVAHLEMTASAYRDRFESEPIHNANLLQYQ